MKNGIRYSPVVVRTGRGLTVAGTRITLYQIMDFLKAGYPPEEIRDDLRLSIRQMNEVMKHIESHRDEFENEYRQVLALATAKRNYWEERNRERLARIAETGPKPCHMELWSRLQTWKENLARQEQAS